MVQDTGLLCGGLLVLLSDSQIPEDTHRQHGSLEKQTGLNREIFVKSTGTWTSSLT